MRGLIFLHPPALPRRNTESATLIIPVSYGGYIPLLLGIWLGLWAVLEAALAWLVIGVHENGMASPGLLLGFLLLSTAAGAFLAWRLLWVLRGREVLEITPEHLTLRRKPAGGRPETFERSEIRDLGIGSLRERVIYPSWGRRFVGKGDSFVVFRYRGEIHRLGRGLDYREAQAVVEFLLPKA